jgi:hypothetical protein
VLTSSHIANTAASKGQLSNLDLTIELTDLYSLGPAATLAVQRTHPLICDRCHDGEEPVVAIMKILPLEQGALRWLRQ